MLKAKNAFNLNRSFYSTISSIYANQPSKLKSKYDVVIVGGGHNGLVAANYLAKYSKKPNIKICVLESRNILGGAAVTEEITPGFKFSRASYLLSLFRPKIIQDLDLMRHNMLKFHIRDPSSYTPLLESDPQYSSKSRSLTLSANADFNRKEISKFSKQDAEAYENYEEWLNGICSVLEEFIDKEPISQRELDARKSVFSKLSYLKSNLPNRQNLKFMSKNYEHVYRLFTQPAANILDEWFESDVLKASLATDSVIGAMLSPYSAGSAYVLLHHIIGGIEGKKGVWAYVEGGMGSISNCLAKNAKSFPNDPIEIYLSHQVSQIVVDDASTSNPIAKGVLLEDGKYIEADYVLSNCTPHVTFMELLKRYNFKNHTDTSISSYFKQIDSIDYESGTMKINLAINKLPDFRADPSVSESPMPHHRCTIHINCENMKLLDDAWRDAKLKGKASEKPMIEMVIPSTLDPTISPKGSHVALLFCQYFPIDRETNEKTKQQYAETVLNEIEKYAPGFKDSIIYRDILAPYDLEKTFGLTGGNIFHGSMSLSQLYFSRPVVGWSNYDTPIKNLILAGSGAHPGGGVMGSAGRLAALKYLSLTSNS